MTLERNLFFLGHRKIVFSLFLTGEEGKGGTDREGRLLHIVHKQTIRRGRTDGQKEQEQGGRGVVQGKRGGRRGAREKERERERVRGWQCALSCLRKNETKQLSDTSNIKNIEQKSYE